MLAPPPKRGQTTTEYLFMAVGIIIFIVLVYMLLQSNVVGPGKKKVESGLGDFLKLGEHLLFFDNFDSGSANKWNANSGNWMVINKEYVQSDTNNSQKTTHAGSAGWVNYYADTKIFFSSVPAVLGQFAGLSGRVNKNTGARYACAFVLTNAGTPKEGQLHLLRFFDWGTYSATPLASSATFGIDAGIHLLGMQFSGNGVKCYWDDVEKLSFTDATPYKNGLIALEQRLAETHFDSVRVKYINGPNPSGPTPTPPSGDDNDTYVCIPLSTCRTPKPAYCDASGEIVNNCATCGCPAADYSCEPDGSCLRLTCSDGTFYSQCSSSKPQFCDNGNLVDRCGSPESCGCPNVDDTCNPDGTCTPATPTPPPGGNDSLIISDVVNYSITNSSAIINWSVSLPANGTVEYGLTSGYGFSVFTTQYLQQHSLNLSGLANSTLYHYKITSCNATLCNSTDDFTFTAQPNAFCSDSDGSYLYQYQQYIAGSGTDETGTVNDYCVGDTLYENVCVGDDLQLFGSPCSTGCSAGKCNNFCTDNDISIPTPNRYYNAGLNTNGTGSFYDYCTGSKLQELSCSGTDIANTTYSCFAGCSSGKCNEFCADSDGGILHGTYGSGVNYTSYPGSFPESCSGNLNTEFYCDGTTLKVTVANCQTCVTDPEIPSITYCAGSYCSDTDGNDAYSAGIGTNQTGSYNDACVSGTQVREYTCAGTALQSAVVNCDSGETCSSGACNAIEGGG